MAWINRWRTAVLAVAGALLIPAGAQAGLLWGWWHSDAPPECDPGSYNHLHYCAPEMWNIYAFHHGVRGMPVSVYAPPPCTPAGYFITPSHCPYEPPGIPCDIASGAHTLDFNGTAAAGTPGTSPKSPPGEPAKGRAP